LLECKFKSEASNYLVGILFSKWQLQTKLFHLFKFSSTQLKNKLNYQYKSYPPKIKKKINKHGLAIYGTEMLIR